MQRVLHDGRRFWIIQLNYIKEELARTDMKEVTEAYSAHTDTHTVYKRNTVYERSIRITTDYCCCYYYDYLLLLLLLILLLLLLLLLLLVLLLLLRLRLPVDTVILYQCVTCQDTGIVQ